MPWIALADTPTPITELPAPPGFRGRLFAKRDDLTSTLFGGNKVRKFEYLLADAERQGAASLVTLGGIGSNQALGAALHGRARGHAVDVSLVGQPVTEGVRRALGGMVAAGARVRYADSKLGALRNVRRALRERRRAGEHPYSIPFGATNALGSLGYASAALELGAQVQAGACPRPDALFVAAGSCGTAAGLLVGLRLAGLETRIIAVGVVYGALATRALLVWHANHVAALLSRIAPAAPRLRFAWRDVTVLGEYLGPGYGQATRAAHHAVAWARPHLTLETTYTGKALAACLEHCGPDAHERAVLFWNTNNASQFLAATELDGLPDRLQRLLQELP